MRKRSLQCLDVFRSSHRAAGKNFDEIRAGFPGGDDFGGRQRPGHHQLPFPYRKLDDLKVEPRTDQKLRTRVETTSRGFRVENGSSSDKNTGSTILRQVANDLDGAGHSHGD